MAVAASSATATMARSLRSLAGATTQRRAATAGTPTALRPSGRFCRPHCRCCSSSSASFVFPAPATTTLSVKGGGAFPVRRIYCVGRNYWDHSIEMGDDPERDPPFFFHKPTDAAVDCSCPGCKVKFPTGTEKLAYEGELVVAIGKEGSDVSKSDAASFIWGYGAGVDLTRRDLQDVAKQMRRPWCTSKGFDFSGPVGELVRSKDFSWKTSSVELKVNGETKQQAALDRMIWKPEEVIEYLSAYYRLYPGDLIFTGTPAGVGKLSVGDHVECLVEGLPSCSFVLE